MMPIGFFNVHETGEFMLFKLQNIFSFNLELALVDSGTRH
jgi:hypothetical protein